MASVLLIENKKAVPSAFNKIARRYDFATGMSQGYQSDLNYSASLLELSGNETVLDLCCGTGKSTRSVLGFIREGKVVGVDNSQEMLGEARRKFSKEMATGKVELFQQDAMELDFPAGSFDAIFIAYGLRNMPDYGKCLEGLRQMLKPGGKLVIHDYALSDHPLAKPYWIILGYGFILPFCTVVTGNSGIFSYLIQSVSEFLRPSQVEILLKEKGFIHIKTVAHKGWRKPVLKAFIAEKQP